MLIESCYSTVKNKNILPGYDIFVQQCSFIVSQAHKDFLRYFDTVLLVVRIASEKPAVRSLRNSDMDKLIKEAQALLTANIILELFFHNRLKLYN